MGRHVRSSGRRSAVGTWAVVGSIAAFACAGPRALAAQAPANGVSGQRAIAPLPFAVGERLTYRVHVAKLGTLGRGVMSIDSTETVRGEETYVLRFSFRTRVGPVKAVNESESWLDPRRMAALRFHKHERHPLSRHDEAVEIYPDQRRWESADGVMRDSPTNAPLDELSFIYFIRTLPLDADTVYRFERHFDAARSPTTVRVTGRDTVTTEAGTFPTIAVEMRVKDPRRYRGEGVILFHFTDDAYRLPVRIESAMPVVGRGVLTLESYKLAAAPIVARAH